MEDKVWLDQENGEHSTFVNEDIPLDPLLGGKKQSHSRRESRRRSHSTTFASISRIIKSPMFLLLCLVIFLIVIITLALQTVSKTHVKKPILAKAPEIIKDSRPRYAFDSSESYKLSADTAAEKTWTKAGPDGSYVKRKGMEIVMRHLETDGEMILAASGDIKDVRSFSTYYVGYW